MRAVLLLAVLAAAVDANRCWSTRCLSPAYCIVDDEVGYAHCVTQHPCANVRCPERCIVDVNGGPKCVPGLAPPTPPTPPTPLQPVENKGCVVDGKKYEHGSYFTQQCLQCRCMDGATTQCVIINGNAC